MDQKKGDMQKGPVCCTCYNAGPPMSSLWDGVHRQMASSARAVQAPGPCRDTHVTHLGCYCCCFAQTGIQKQQSQLLCLAKKSSLGKAALSPTWNQLQGALSHCPGFFLPGRGGATQANWTLKGQETAWSQATFVVFVTWRPKSLH